MISGPEILVECDTGSCSSNLYLQPEYMYLDYSGKNGYYDCSEKAIEKQIVAEYWSCIDGKHFCECCIEDNNEKDTQNQSP